ncbi:hypothetical protein [Candidatus Avelusimicrobium alvi]|uniref:hypothetical protein n=1 Tax=Candidatus Avelusimicrobium alvi TaxID=3416221 RepID=UPI003D12B761
MFKLGSHFSPLAVTVACVTQVFPTVLLLQAGVKAFASFVEGIGSRSMVLSELDIQFWRQLLFIIGEPTAPSPTNPWSVITH